MPRASVVLPVPAGPVSRTCGKRLPRARAPSATRTQPREALLLTQHAGERVRGGRRGRRRGLGGASTGVPASKRRLPPSPRSRTRCAWRRHQAASTSAGSAASVTMPSPGTPAGAGSALGASRVATERRIRQRAGRAGVHEARLLGRRSLDHQQPRVHEPVAARAERDQVLDERAAAVRAELDVMHHQRPARAARAAALAVAAQHAPAHARRRLHVARAVIVGVRA